MLNEIACPCCKGWSYHYPACVIEAHGTVITKEDRTAWHQAKLDREEKAYSSLYDVLVAAQTVGNSI